jgi:hypothetical protein
MAGPTRRTHIVRIYGKNKDGSQDKGTFADVEVLDAVSFSFTNGKQMILNCPAKKANPYIVDDTGQNLGKSPASGTRRSHVKKYTGSNGSILYAEVLDAIAFNDENGGEWILDTSSPTVFDKTDGSGDASSTRRGHDEKVPKPKDASKPAKNSYVNVQRCDMVAFRSVLGHEMIVKMPSADDGTGPRADTFISNVPDYAPSNDATQTPPPENTDPNFYIAFDPKGATPFMDDTKIQQGPLWWIRNMVHGGDYLSVEFSGNEDDTHLADFFDTITFGGDGTGDGADLSKADLSAQFFGFDGSDGQAIVSGGAGVFDDGTGINGPFENGFTAAMLAAKIEFASGKKVSGFAISHHRNTNAGVTYYLKLSDLGSGDINIFVSTGPEQPYPVSLATFQKGVVKVGAAGPDIATEIDDKYEQKITLPGGSDWGGISVNTKTLKFTIPAGELGNGITGILDLGRGAEAPPMP